MIDALPRPWLLRRVEICVGGSVKTWFVAQAPGEFVEGDLDVLSGDGGRIGDGGSEQSVVGE